MSGAGCLGVLACQVRPFLPVTLSELLTYDTGGQDRRPLAPSREPSTPSLKKKDLSLEKEAPTGPALSLDMLASHTQLLKTPGISGSFLSRPLKVLWEETWEWLFFLPQQITTKLHLKTQGLFLS